MSILTKFTLSRMNASTMLSTCKKETSEATQAALTMLPENPLRSPPQTPETHLGNPRQTAPQTHLDQQLREFGSEPWGGHLRSPQGSCVETKLHFVIRIGEHIGSTTGTAVSPAFTFFRTASLLRRAWPAAGRLRGTMETNSRSLRSCSTTHFQARILDQELRTQFNITFSLSDAPVSPSADRDNSFINQFFRPIDDSWPEAY